MALFSLFLLLGPAFAAAEAPFIARSVASETGFEGAVTVVETAVDEKEPDIGYVTVDIPYRDIYGAPKVGQGRLVVRRAEAESGKPVPAFCHVHYEKDVGGAKKWCKRGWAVATVHYGDPKTGGHPLDLCTGDSNNLARALIEWVRRLPLIDRTHFHLDGGSAGGYMALAMSADFFPVTSTTADAPVCNWAYNVNYLVANKPATKYPLPDPKGPAEDFKRTPLPVLYAISGLADQSIEIFGSDLASDAWYWLSPISYLDRITCPVMIQCATGDMLVPLEQMSGKYPPPLDKSLFPESYTRDFETLTLSPKARRRFDEIIPADQVAVHLIPLPEGAHEYTLANFLHEEKEPPSPPNQDRPWDKDKQWNLCIFDEGPPKPFSSHTRFKWGSSPDGFVEAHQQAAPGVALLNAAKLDRLVQRYTGALKNEAVLAKTGQPANRLNYAPLEKLDVLTGLIDYATLSDAHAQRLSELYAAGPEKPFGPSLTKEVLQKELAAVRSALALK